MIPIDNRPIAVAPIAVNVNQTFVISIITKVPIIIVPEEIRFWTLIFNARPIVSTSLVTRDNVSPTVVLLKKAIGNRFILLDISVRKLLVMFCVIFTIIQPWSKLNSPPNPYKNKIEKAIFLMEIMSIFVFNHSLITS